MVQVQCLVKDKKIKWDDITAEKAEALGQQGEEADDALRRLVELGRGRTMPVYHDMALQFSIRVSKANKRTTSSATAVDWELEWPVPATRAGASVGFTKRFWAHFGAENLLIVRIGAPRAARQRQNKKAAWGRGGAGELAIKQVVGW